MTSVGRSNHEQLARLLRDEGILRAGPEQEIRHPDGSLAPWMFYSWNFSLAAAGLRLAAACLLERLEGFHGKQLAAHGTTALPLLAACVELGGGRYTGLAVRKTRKQYLSGRRVEGVLRRDEPVVVLDDSISSGRALHDAIAALEAEGLTVEGSLALVSFPNRGGLEWANEAGYRAEALFDIGYDLGQPLYQTDAPSVLDVPVDGGRPLRDGLHPAELAREVAHHFLRFGTLPVLPNGLEGAGDGRGGVFVSFRQKRDNKRLARDGFWHFDSGSSNPIQDIARATIRTLEAGGGRVHLGNLDSLKIAVTFMGPLEAIEPAELDFDRYAIVVRDRNSGGRRGGALPNTQVFTNEVQQYRHALVVNAGLAKNEPHDLFRQEVSKSVERDADWPSYGSADGPRLAWANDSGVGEALTRFARSLLENPSTTNAEAVAIGYPIEGIAVSLYRAGHLATAVAWGDRDAVSLTREAATKVLRAVAPGVKLHDVTVQVTVLYEREEVEQAEAATKVQRGLTAVRAQARGQSSLLLPGALVYNNWSKEQLVQAAVSRLSPAASSERITTYRTAQWAVDAHGIHRIRSGFPLRSDAARRLADPTSDIRALVEFSLRHARDGIPAYHVDTVRGVVTREGTGPRLLHALVAMDRAGLLLAEPSWREEAARGFQQYLTNVDVTPGGFGVSNGGPLADAILLAGLRAASHPLAGHPAIGAVRQRLIAMVGADGRIAARRVHLEDTQDFDFLPGAVLTAIGVDGEALDAIPARTLQRTLAWNRNRFAVLRSWGMVGWQTQGWAAIWQHTRDEAHAAFVFELADWALRRQLRKNGAFLEDLSPDEPSFNTGFIAEGMSAAWRIALETGDEARAAQYAESWERANGFMRGLLIRPEDNFCLRIPAAGGVRLTPSRSDVRADSVSHWLHALVSGASLRASRRPQTTTKWTPTTDSASAGQTTAGSATPRDFT